MANHNLSGNNLKVLGWSESFGRDSADVKAALAYMKHWGGKANVGYLENALTTVKAHGSDSEWDEAETILDEKFNRINHTRVMSSFTSGYYPVAVDYDDTFLVRYEGSEEKSRKDRFAVKSYSQIRSDSKGR